MKHVETVMLLIRGLGTHAAKWISSNCLSAHPANNSFGHVSRFTEHPFVRLELETDEKEQ